jgi:hypothetical protein
MADSLSNMITLLLCEDMACVFDVVGSTIWYIYVTLLRQRLKF